MGGTWSPGPGPAWCQLGSGSLGRCQGVPQVRSRWRAPVAGTSDRTRRWAGGHQTPEGQRPLSFLRPLPGRLRRAPAVVVHPRRPGGSAASQQGWGAPRRMGPVGRVAGAVSGACAVTPCLLGLALRGSSPHPLLGSLVGCRSPWSRVRGVPSPRAADRPVTQGGRRLTS